MADSGVTDHRCPSCDESIYFLTETCPHCGEAPDWHYVAPCEECGTEIDYLDGECDECSTRYTEWEVIEKELLATGQAIAVPKSAVPRPSTAGYTRHLGTIKGQWADYRRKFTNGNEFHVQVFRDHYEIHLDDVSAIDDPALHMIRYGPRVVEITGTGMYRSMKHGLKRSSKILGDSLRAPFILLPDLDEGDHQ
jgi:hypothetical protein